MEYQKRKHPRLSSYDYSQSGVYFITICTKDKKRILCDIVDGTSKPIVGRDDLGTPFYGIEIKYTPTGRIVDKYIKSITQNYENVSVDKYVIMPNHIHILISLIPKDSRRAESSRPTKISQIIGVLKRLINKEIGENIFQTSFYDHIIRDEEDYIIKWKYIEENPIKWLYYDEKEPDEIIT